jgi:hypothetical protein
MRCRARLFLPTLLLLACGSGGVRPDDMSAQAHRQEAAYERRAADQRDREAAQQVDNPPAGYDPSRPSQISLDPTSRLRAEAESRRAHAVQHEAAARDLERFEAQECTGIEPHARATCPVLGPSAARRDIPGGVRIEPPASTDPAALLALMRCQHAHAQARGFRADAAACPLYLRGIEIRASADGKAVEIVARTEALAREIRQRIGQLAGGAPEAKVR